MFTDTFTSLHTFMSLTLTALDAGNLPETLDALYEPDEEDYWDPKWDELDNAYQEVYHFLASERQKEWDGEAPTYGYGFGDFDELFTEFVEGNKPSAVLKKLASTCSAAAKWFSLTGDTKKAYYFQMLTESCELLREDYKDRGV